jgi:hypothetical protein
MSVMNLAGIHVLVGQKCVNYAPLDFQIHRSINVSEAPGRRNAFLRETSGGFGNQKMARNFSGCKEVEFIAIARTQHQKAASLMIHIIC